MLRNAATITINFDLSGADCHDVVDEHWINGYPTPIANPMSTYPRYHDYRKSWGINAMGGVVVEVEADGGVAGIGELAYLVKGNLHYLKSGKTAKTRSVHSIGVSIGGEPACYIVEHHLSRFVEGQNPADVELIWDQMFRSTLNYGRKGLPMLAK